MKTSLVVGLLLLLASIVRAESFVTEASYYTKASCLKESGQCLMANGKELVDEAFTVASWDFRFGTKLRITNQRNGRQVVAVVTDRGPSKRLYKKGRRIDLSKATFEAIEDIKKGLATVVIEVI